MHERAVALRCELLLLLKTVSLEIVLTLMIAYKKMRVLIERVREKEPLLKK